MNPERHAAYRRFLSIVERLGSDRLGAETVERLRDVAEGLLLARQDGDADELERHASMLLSGLVADGRSTDRWADRLWCELAACGPNPPVGRNMRFVRDPAIAGRDPSRPT